ASRRSRLLLTPDIRSARCRPLPYTTLFRSEMKEFSVVEISTALDATMVAIEPEQRVAGRVVTDSREVTDGAIFVARRGENLDGRSEEHTSELQSRFDLVCRLLLEKQNKTGT